MNAYPFSAMTTVLDAEAESIVNEIHKAFVGIRRGAITLHEAEVIDDYGSAEQRAAARKLDTDGRWERVPDAHVEKCTTALSYVDPESWRYYIAPYMIWSLKYFRTNRSVVSNHTIYTFNPDEKPGDMQKYSMERYRLLNSRQAQCVCRFLRYMARNDEFADGDSANEALQKYWGRFCGSDGS